MQSKELITVTAAYLLSQGFSITAPARFWSKVNKDGPVPAHCPELGPCWLWTASSTTDGYGRFWCGTVAGRVSTHRASWIFHFGPIPADRPCVLHRCDTHLCVNPAHLWLGTSADNARDMLEKGRQRRGEGKPNHKLTSEQVREIRTLCGVSQRELGRMYGVSQPHIYRILNMQEWVS